MSKRILLFLATNVLIVLTITVLLQVLGVQPYITQAGLDLGQLAAFCLVWGMGGAFVSLAISRIVAKYAYGVQVVPADTRDPRLQQLVQSVHRLSRAAGLPQMPEVGLYDSPEVNAFATGPTRSRALVAVSTGLMRNMDDDEIEGVLAHEVAHIANGDMVTLTLAQGVVNAFVMFLARLAAYALTRGSRNAQGTRVLITIGFQLVFAFFGSLVVAWFSRQREFRADAGGARYAGRESMVAALERLRSASGVRDERAPASLQAFKISSRGGLLQLLPTHPPLEVRIARLRQG